MPSESERASGILADDYYQKLIHDYCHKMDRRREKIIQYLQYSFETF